MKPHILHVIDHTGSGGAQVVIRYLMQALARDFDFSVAVLGETGRYSEDYRALGIPVFELGRGHSRWSPLPMWGLLDILRRQRCDLVHAHLFRSSILATLCAKWTGHSTIIHDHSGIYPESLTQRSHFSRSVLRSSYLCAYRHSLNLAERLVVLTPKMLEAYARFYAIAPRKIVVVPNAVDASTFEQKGGRVGSLHRELGLQPETKLVIAVGRLEPEKDSFTFLQVAHSVRQLSDRSCAFLLVGSGSEESALREYVAANQIESTFFLGYRDDVPFLLREADVFLLTSRSETFGISLLEAMAAGCPVVSTRSGGPETIVTHGVNGLLADVGDVKGLTSQVLHLLHDPDFGRMLVHNARRTAKSRYNLEAVSARMALVYREVLGQ